jgi:hypothetical protein
MSRGRFCRLDLAGHELPSSIQAFVDSHLGRVFDPSRKDRHWVKREIKEGSMTDGRHLLVIVARQIWQLIGNTCCPVKSDITCNPLVSKFRL